jgi:transposase-like protein
MPRPPDMRCPSCESPHDLPAVSNYEGRLTYCCPVCGTSWVERAEPAPGVLPAAAGRVIATVAILLGAALALLLFSAC